jgi:hypothetical protein
MYGAYIYGSGQPYSYGIFGREITQCTVMYGAFIYIYIYTVLANPR